MGFIIWGGGGGNLYWLNSILFLGKVFFGGSGGIFFGEIILDWFSSFFWLGLIVFG